MGIPHPRKPKTPYYWGVGENFDTSHNSSPFRLYCIESFITNNQWIQSRIEGLVHINIPWGQGDRTEEACKCTGTYKWRRISGGAPGDGGLPWCPRAGRGLGRKRWCKCGARRHAGDKARQGKTWHEKTSGWTTLRNLAQTTGDLTEIIKSPRKSCWSIASILVYYVQAEPWKIVFETWCKHL